MKKIKTMTAKEAYEIALNDPVRRITDKKIIEEAILTDPVFIIKYAKEIIEARWEEGENVIVNLDGKKEVNTHLFPYVKDMHKSDYGKRLIDNSIFYSFVYYKEVIDEPLSVNTPIEREILKDIELCLGSISLGYTSDLAYLMN